MWCFISVCECTYCCFFFFKEKHLRAMRSKYPLFILLPNSKQCEGLSPHITEPKPLGVCKLWYIPHSDIYQLAKKKMYLLSEGSTYRQHIFYWPTYRHPFNFCCVQHLVLWWCIEKKIVFRGWCDTGVGLNYLPTVHQPNNLKSCGSLAVDSKK